MDHCIPNKSFISERSVKMWEIYENKSSIFICLIKVSCKETFTHWEQKISLLLLIDKLSWLKNASPRGIRTRVLPFSGKHPIHCTHGDVDHQHKIIEFIYVFFFSLQLSEVKEVSLERKPYSIQLETQPGPARHVTPRPQIGHAFTNYIYF